MQLHRYLGKRYEYSRCGSAPHAVAATIAQTVTAARISAWCQAVILLTGERLPFCSRGSSECLAGTERDGRP